MPWAPPSQPLLNQSAFDSGIQEIHSGDLTFLAIGGEKGNEADSSKSKPGNLGQHEHMTGRVNKGLIVHQPLNYQGLIRHIPTAFISQDSLYCPALFERPFNLFPLLILIGIYLLFWVLGFTMAIYFQYITFFCYIRPQPNQYLLPLDYPCCYCPSSPVSPLLS